MKYMSESSSRLSMARSAWGPKLKGNIRFWPISACDQGLQPPQSGLRGALLKQCWRGSIHWLRMNTVASLKLCPEGIKLALQLEL